MKPVSPKGRRFFVVFTPLLTAHKSPFTDVSAGNPSLSLSMSTSLSHYPTRTSQSPTLAGRGNGSRTEKADQSAYFGNIANKAAIQQARNTERLFELTQGLVNDPKSGASWLKRKFSNFVTLDESVLGASAILFLQDTLAVWLPKMTAMRSWAEAVETTFLEFVESALFYFSAPILGQHVFSKIIRSSLLDNKDSRTAHHVERNHIAQSLGELNKKINLDKLANELKTGLGNTNVGRHAKKVIALKAGTVVATLSAMMLEYTLSFAKNLITLKFFNTGDFNHVADLKDPNAQKTPEQLAADERTEKKAIRRLWQGGALAAGFFAAGLGLARGATRSKTLFNFSRRLLKTFDFNYNQVFARVKRPLGKRLKNFFSKAKTAPQYVLDKVTKQPKLITKFGLTKGQKIAIITLGGIGYLDASRNRLEVYENLFRVWGVVMPYLMFGKEFLTERLRRLLHGEVRLPNALNFLQPGDKTIAKFREIYQWDSKLNHGKGGGRYLSVDEIAQKAIEKAGLSAEFVKQATPQQVRSWVNSDNPQLRKASQEFKRLMGPKNTSFGAPLAFGIFGVGLAVAWLNRFWTAYRYKQQQQKAPQVGGPPPITQVPSPTNEFPLPAAPLQNPQVWTPTVSLQTRLTEQQRQFNAFAQ